MPKNKSLPKGLARCSFGTALSLLLVPLNAAQAEDTNDTARFSDQPAPLVLKGFPERPPPLIELGDKFLGNGNLQKGITLPTGEVISPNFWVFGTYRTAVQTFDSGAYGKKVGDSRITEWVNRLDLYGNLQFTPTERILVGWRPLDRQYPDGTDAFTGYRMEGPSTKEQPVGAEEAFGATPTTFFFEGEFGEMFPRMDEHDKKNFDYGFSVGRQPLLLQDGILANTAVVDMLTVTRNSLLIPGGSTVRLSGYFAWDDIERQDEYAAAKGKVPPLYPASSVANVKDPDAHMVGLNAAADFPVSTVEGDVLYEFSSQPGVYAGLGSIQRLGKLNSTIRAVESVAVDGPGTKTTTGTLFVGQLSYTIPSEVNFVYLDGYWGLDRFVSADRDPTTGGPLGDVGLLTAAVGIGSYGAPLSNQADHSAGGAIGYQMFFGELRRKQLTFEIGGRAPTQTPGVLRQKEAEGLAARYSQAFGRRFVLVVDSFCVARQSEGVSWGGRVEWETKF